MVKSLEDDGFQELRYNRGDGDISVAAGQKRVFAFGLVDRSNYTMFQAGRNLFKRQDMIEDFE